MLACAKADVNDILTRKDGKWYNLLRSDEGGNENVCVRFCTGWS